MTGSDHPFRFGLDLRINCDITHDDARLTQTKLTPTFVQKLYSSVATVGNRMDFKTFTEFVVANTYFDEPQSITYFIRILDCKGKGYLDEFDLHYFYKVCSIYV